MTPYEELCRRWPRLLKTALWIGGGSAVLPGFPGEESLAMLREEASGIVDSAVRQEWPYSNDVEWRGGQPLRFLRGAPAGPALNGLFGGRAMLDTVSGLLATPVRLAGGGSLAIYDHKGDALGLHRDIEVCDVTLVTCLWDEGPRGGGALRVYPEYAALPLSAVPAERERMGRTVSLQPGDTAVLLGGIIPHEVTAMRVGQRRIVSLVCYQMLDGDGPETWTGSCANGD